MLKFKDLELLRNFKEDLADGWVLFKIMEHLNNTSGNDNILVEEYNNDPDNFILDVENLEIDAISDGLHVYLPYEVDNFVIYSELYYNRRVTFKDVSVWQE